MKIEVGEEVGTSKVRQLIRTKIYELCKITDKRNRKKSKRQSIT